MKKLTQEQIQELYVFTNRRLVKHYELQTELVDHLANGIEIQLSQNPTLTFKDALALEYAKFGYFGFKNVLKQRKKAINKTYNTLILKEFKTFFTYPRILILIFTIITFFGFLRILPIDNKWVISAVIFLPIILYFWIHSLKIQNSFNNKSDNVKRWMLKEKIYNIGGIGLMCVNLIHMFNLINFISVLRNNIYFDVFISCVVVVNFVFCYVAIFIIPKRAEEILQKKYPEYKFVNQ